MEYGAVFGAISATYKKFFNKKTLFGNIILAKKSLFYTYINNFYLSILLLACYFCSNFFNRATASLVCSLSPKAVKRKNPSPFCPNPAPGVPTTWASLKR